MNFTQISMCALGFVSTVGNVFSMDKETGLTGGGNAMFQESSTAILAKPGGKRKAASASAENSDVSTNRKKDKRGPEVPSSIGPELDDRGFSGSLLQSKLASAQGGNDAGVLALVTSRSVDALLDSEQEVEQEGESVVRQSPGVKTTRDWVIYDFSNSSEFGPQGLGLSGKKSAGGRADACISSPSSSEDDSRHRFTSNRRTFAGEAAAAPFLDFGSLSSDAFDPAAGSEKDAWPCSGGGAMLRGRSTTPPPTTHSEPSSAGSELGHIFGGFNLDSPGCEIAPFKNESREGQGRDSILNSFAPIRF